MTTPATLPDQPSTAAAYALGDVGRFSQIVLNIPLRDYQLEPLRAVLDSVLYGHGREFLLVFPRQSGKNEAVAHLLVYLLTLFQRRGGQIVYGAIGDGLGRGVRRLEERLDNPWTGGRWRREARPRRIVLGRAAVAFLSSHPRAASRGETADHLLVIDEAQDQDASHIEAVFTPMRAARNATAVYLGTVRLSTDFLWRKKGELEALTALDGQPRVFMVGPETVSAANPAYARFLDSQVARSGRRHPIIAAEYFLEPLDGAGGLFPPWRLALMRGRHARQTDPRPDQLLVATIDVGGQDEAAGDALSRLENPGRDYTVATIFEVAPGQSDLPGLTPQPVYRAVDVFVDHGSRHFREVVGRQPLAHRLLAFLRHWNVTHTIIDASGLGQGLADWLGAALGANQVTAFRFSGAAVKARLGSDFLALVETGRFKYWTGDEEEPGSDGWWFWRQAEACAYTVGSGGRFDRDLRWGVPERARVSLPGGPQATHDDRLLSAALVVELDGRLRDGQLALGSGRSVVVRDRRQHDGLA
jgi:hypothetical protein